MPVSPDAIIRKEAPLKAAFSPESQLAGKGKLNTIAKEIREKVDQDMSEGKSPFQSYKEKVGQAESQISPERAKTRIDESFGGIERDKNGGRIQTSGEKGRLDSAIEAEGLARAMSEAGGYDKLSGNPRLQERLRNFVEDAFKIDPTLEKILPADPTSRQAFLESILKEPEAFLLIKKGHQEVFAKDKPTLEDKVNPAKKELEEAEFKEGEQRRARDKNVKDLGTATSELERFEPGKDLDKELEGLTSRQTQIERARREAQDELNSVSEEIRNLRRKMRNASAKGEDTNTIESQVKVATEERSRLEQEVEDRSKEIARQRELQAKKEKLKEDVERLTQENPGLEHELEQAVKETFDKKATLEKVKKERSEMEQDYLDEIRSIIPDAIQKFIENRLEQYDGAGQSVFDRLVSEAKDKVDKEFWLAEQQEIKKKKTGFGRLSDPNGEEDDRNAILKKSSTLMDPSGDGPAKLVKARLDTMLAQGKITKEEYSQRLSDKDWMDTTSEQVAVNTMAAVLRVGKITETQAEFIINSKWGGDILEKAVTKNTALKETMDNLRRQGIIGEGLSGLKGSTALRILLLAILGIGAVAAVGALGPAMGILNAH